jgi:putative membrane protein
MLVTDSREGSGESEKRSPHARVPEEKRATEYLANERTFLAWIRTSIAIVSIGFALTRLSLGWSTESVRLKFGSSGTSFTMGIALMAFGALLAILAVWRYQVVNRAIDEGRVKADRGLIFLVTGLVVFISVGAIAYMLLVER